MSFGLFDDLIPDPDPGQEPETILEPEPKPEPEPEPEPKPAVLTPAGLFQDLIPAAARPVSGSPTAASRQKPAPTATVAAPASDGPRGDDQQSSASAVPGQADPPAATDTGSLRPIGAGHDLRRMTAKVLANPMPAPEPDPLPAIFARGLSAEELRREALAREYTAAHKSSELLRWAANDPVGFAKGLKETAMGLLAVPGKLAYYTAADAIAHDERAREQAIKRLLGDDTPVAEPEYGGNLKSLMAGEEVQPADRLIHSAASAAPNTAVAAKLGQSLTEMAPMMAVNPGGTLGRVVAAGFAADMTVDAKRLLDEFAIETHKPPGEQDPGKIAELKAGILQTLVFLPLAALHAAKPIDPMAVGSPRGTDGETRPADTATAPKPGAPAPEPAAAPVQERPVDPGTAETKPPAAEPGSLDDNARRGLFEEQVPEGSAASPEPVGAKTEAPPKPEAETKPPAEGPPTAADGETPATTGPAPEIAPPEAPAVTRASLRWQRQRLKKLKGRPEAAAKGEAEADGETPAPAAPGEKPAAGPAAASPAGDPPRRPVDSTGPETGDEAFSLGGNVTGPPTGRFEDVQDVVNRVAPKAGIKVSNGVPPIEKGRWVKGWKDKDGSVTLYARAIETRADARAVLVEELGHRASEQPELQDLVSRLLATLRPDEVEAMRRLGYDADVAPNEALQRRLVAEDLTAQQRTLWERVRLWLADFWRRTFGKPAPDSDLRELLRAALKSRRVPGRTAFSLAADNFREQLNRFKLGEALSGTHIPVGLPGEILRSAGVPDGPMFIGHGVLEKARSKHGIPLFKLYRLPEAINDPLFVFRSRMEPDAVTVLTELRHGGQNLLAALHFKERGGGGAEITDIASVYDKPAMVIGQWIKDGLTVYKSGKALEWLAQELAPLQLREVRGHLSARDQGARRPPGTQYSLGGPAEAAPGPPPPPGHAYSLGRAVTEPVRRRVTADDLRDLVKRVAPKAEIEVSEEAPPVIDGRWVAGELDPHGKINLYARAIGSRAEARAVLVEELGHLAVRDGRLKPLVERLRATVTPAELEAMRRLGYGEDVLVEEALMRRLVAEDLTAQQRTLWQQVKTWLADFWRRTFGKPALDSDLRALLRAAMKAERRRGQSRFSQAADEFRDELRRYQFNELPLAFRLRIRQSGDLLRRAGVPEGVITLDQRVLNKTVEAHGIPLFKLYRLPEALNDPLFIFRSAKVPDAATVLTELRQGGDNLLVALHFKADASGVEVTNIASIHGRPMDQVTGWIQEGLTVYLKKEKAREWLAQGLSPLQLRAVWGHLSALDKADTKPQGTQYSPGGPAEAASGPPPPPGHAYSLGRAVTEPVRRRVTADDLRDLVKRVAPKAEIEVSEEAPPVLDGRRVAGELDPHGNITLYARAIGSRAEARAVLVEELGHLAVRDGRLKPLVDRLRATVTPAEIEAMRRLGYGEDVLVEEALMRRLVAEDLTAQQRTLWQQVKTWLADFWRRTFGKPALDSDLRALLRAAMEAEPREGRPMASMSRETNEWRQNLRRLGLEGVNLYGVGLNEGRKMLKKAGFQWLGPTERGRHEFSNPKTRAKVAYDSGRALTGFHKFNHWHIEDDKAQVSLDQNGKIVTGDARHIPAD